MLYSGRFTDALHHGEWGIYDWGASLYNIKLQFERITTKKAVLNIYRTAYYRKYNFRINIYSRGVTNLFQGFTTASSISCTEFSTP